VSGYFLQALTSNPLAEPYLLGIASAANLTIQTVFFFAIPVFVAGVFVLPWYAFVASGVTTFVLYKVALRNGMLRTVTLILAGVALSSLFSAIGSLLIFYSGDSDVMRTMIFWAFGSFSKAKLSQLVIPYGSLILILIGSIPFLKSVHLIALGAQKSKTLGLNTTRTQTVLIISASWLTAWSVALAGPIGFIGLVVPHFVRAFYGHHNRFNVIFAALLGAVFALTCDMIAVVWFQKIGMPVGIISSFIGIPFFLYVLFRKNYRLQ
jgi:iron complex transport system permease protein